MEFSDSPTTKKHTTKWTTILMSKLRTSSNHHKHSNSSNNSINIPNEFLCPISNSLMTQPVIVSSGHTYDLSSIHLCQNLHFTPSLPDGTVPDFSTLIPNLALRSTILHFAAVNNIPLSLPQQPPITTDEDRIVAKLRSSESEIQQTLESLRALTRSTEGSRVLLCTPRILSVLKLLLKSSCGGIQANAVATVVNLSLEKVNKVKILRSGIVPILVDLVRGGFHEAKDHACSALFSLALDDENKTAIGVLGALQPLLHALRSSARNDAAWALYYLTMVQSNRVKLVKLGAVQSLLMLVIDSQIGCTVLLILGNLAGCVEGRGSLLDAGTVGVLVSMLGRDGNENGMELNISALESCMSVLDELSRGGLRFKILAKEAGSLEVLRKFEEFSGSERVKDKARKVMEAVMDKWEEIEEDVDWEELIDLGLANGNGSGNSGCSVSGHF